MKKKIGILTFNYGCNYGGTLQCIGLYKALKQLKLEKNIEIIDYIPPNMYDKKIKYLIGTGISRNINENIRKTLKIMKSFFIKLRYVDSALEKFDKFRKENSNMRLYNINEIQDIYDSIIVGSDQVWNVTSQMNGTYFLEGIEGVKKISYAACSGSDFYKKDDEERLRKSINDFQYISVRNNHTYNFVKRLTGKEPEIVCDPSILYDYKEYLTKDKPKEKYILTYILGNEINGGHKKVLEEIKSKVGDIKIIALGIAYAGSGSLQFYPWADEVIYDASPEDWLNLINNAEFIYTDSYHGVLFSMKFHKDFLGYYSEKARASRFIDLSERYDVGDWIVNDIKEISEKNSFGKKIDYNKIDVLLEKHREYSMSFLKKALGENNE